MAALAIVGVANASPAITIRATLYRNITFMKISVKQVYLGKGLTDTLVTTRVDGVPHRVLKTPFVDQLERAGRVSGLIRALGNAWAFRKLSGLSVARMAREGRAMRHGRDLTWSQMVMAANTPMLLKAAMVDGRPDLGVMSAGQVVGLIEDLPSCAELIERIISEAIETLAVLKGLEGQ